MVTVHTLGLQFYRKAHKSMGKWVAIEPLSHPCLPGIDSKNASHECCMKMG